MPITNRPFVEKDKKEFDVTLPLHDSTGKIIATAGMDFKLEPGVTKATVVLYQSLSHSKMGL